ncbi:hypothetical protein GGR52DRAFT_566692 [Hypoxylon sp. FL1284]|nr:hypothetical protein GGR52DRAFT_566692 [Hypoxylon sp. FL1284]
MRDHQLQTTSNLPQKMADNSTDREMAGGAAAPDRPHTSNTAGSTQAGSAHTGSAQTADNFRAEIKALEDRVAIEQAKVRSRDQDIERHLDTILRQKEQLDESASKVAELERDLKSSETMCDSKSESNEKYRELLDSVRSKYELLDFNFINLRDKRDEARKEKNAGEIEYNTLRTEYMFLDNDHRTLAHEEASGRAREKELKESLQRLEADNETLKAENDALKTKAETLKAGYDLQSKTLAKTTSELAAEKQEREKEVKVSSSLLAANEEQARKVTELEGSISSAVENCRITMTRAEAAESELGRECLATARYFASESGAHPVSDETWNEAWIQFARVLRESDLVESGQLSDGQARSPPWTVSQLWLRLSQDPAVSIPERLDASAALVRLYGDVTALPRSNRSLYLLGTLTERLAAESRARPAMLEQLVRVIAQTQPQPRGDGPARSIVEDLSIMGLWRFARLIRDRWGVDVSSSMTQLGVLESSPLYAICPAMRDDSEDDLLASFQAGAYLWPEDGVAVKKFDGDWRVFAHLQARRLQVVHYTRLMLDDIDIGIVYAPKGFQPITVSMIRSRRIAYWLICMSP